MTPPLYLTFVKIFGTTKELNNMPVTMKEKNVNAEYWQLVPTITRDAGGLGACGGLENLIAVHQITVILVSCLCIHNGDIWNDGNLGKKDNEEKSKSLLQEMYDLLGTEVVYAVSP